MPMPKVETVLTKVKLTTAQGLFITDVFCLPLTPPAEIILWGARAFTYYSVADGVLTYKEGLATHALTAGGLPQS